LVAGLRWPGTPSRGARLSGQCRQSNRLWAPGALRQQVDADLAFIVPDDIYRDVIRHDFGGLGFAQFTPVQIAVKAYEGTAWMFLPASRPVPDLADASGDRLWKSAALGALIAGFGGIAKSSLPLPSSDPGAGTHADDPQAEITDDYWGLDHDPTHGDGSDGCDGGGGDAVDGGFL
jgi:hypothetical protein